MLVALVNTNTLHIPGREEAAAVDAMVGGLICVGVGRRRTDEFCSFSIICLAVERRSEPPTADGLTTDRQILFFFTYLSGRQALL